MTLPKDLQQKIDECPYLGECPEPIWSEKEIMDFKKNLGALPSDTQVGGDHYKSLAIQPGEFCQKNKFGCMESNAIKYISRWKLKGKLVDIDKAIHCLELLKEWAYQPIEMKTLDPERVQEFRDKFKALRPREEVDAYIGRLNTGWDKTGL